MRFFGIVFSSAATLLPLSLPAQIAPDAAPPEPPAAVSTPLASLPRSYPVSNGSLTVAPGLTLPNGNLPWALDTFSGKQVLVPLHHATLAGMPSADSGTLAGPHSPNVLHASTPIFFIHTSDRTENSREAGHLSTHSLWLLLPATVDQTTRHFTHPAPSDAPATSECMPSTVCANVEAMPDGWLRIVPAAPLAPGEYVLIPTSKPGKSLAAVVYGFSLDPAGPLAKDAVEPGADLQPHRKKR